MESRSPNTERSSWLAHEAYVAALRQQTARFADVLRHTSSDAPVPTCPEWTTLDLVRHVLRVYTGRATLLRTGDAVPDDAEITDLARALERHDVVVAELADLLAELDPDAEVWTWMEGAGESTVGAWARRMAHEALVHRVDAELTAGVAVGPTADSLAVDGVNEILTWMAGDPDTVASAEGSAGAAGTVLASWGTGAWLVELTDGGHLVTPADPATATDARITGSPAALDLALWGRPSDAGWSGEAAVLERLRARLAIALR